MKKTFLIFNLMITMFSLSAASLKVLPLGEIKPSGWIKNQMLRDITSGYISAYDRTQPSLSRNFFGPVKQKEYSIDKDGNKKAQPAGWWPGEHEGYFADDVVRNAFLTGYAPWMEKAKMIIDNVISNQDKDGYIGVYDKDCRVDKHAFKDGDLWTQSRMQVAILAFYEFTGEKKYLDAVVKAADYNISCFEKSKINYFSQGLSIGLMYIDVLEWLYRITNDQKYLTFAFKFYNDYCNAPANMLMTDMKLDNLLDGKKNFLGHSVHVVDHIRVPFWLSTETKDPRYQEAVNNIFYKLYNTLTPTGAMVTDLKVHESVAGNYGSPTLPYEFCSTTELLSTLASGFQKFGKFDLGDAAENITFNAGQGARFPDGKAIAYCSKDNRSSSTFNDAPRGEGFRYQYAACHSVACCNLEAAKLMPYYVSNSWMKSADGKAIVAFLYGPSEVNTSLNGVKVKLVETTLYPFENSVKISVNPSETKNFDVLLRNPDWSKNTRVTAIGATVKFEKGFIRVTRNWTKGDVINLTFEDKVVVEKFMNNELFLKKGALIYALPLAGKLTSTKEFEGGKLANYDVTLANVNDGDKFNEYKIIMSGKKDATLATIEGKYSDSQTLAKVIEPGSNLFFVKEFAHTGNNAMKSIVDSIMFTYMSNKKANIDYPFDQPFGFILGTFNYKDKMVQDTLVPVGSTLLRKITF